MCDHPQDQYQLVARCGVIWNPHDRPNKFYSFFMAAIVGISSGHGCQTVVHRRNQPIKSKPALYRPLLHFHSHLKTAVHKQQGGVLQSQRWVWHVLGIQKKSWLGLQINVSELLVICDRIWEETHSPHTQFAHLDILKTTGNGIQTWNAYSYNTCAVLTS